MELIYIMDDLHRQNYALISHMSAWTGGKKLRHIDQMFGRQRVASKPICSAEVLWSAIN